MGCICADRLNMYMKTALIFLLFLSINAQAQQTNDVQAYQQQLDKGIEQYNRNNFDSAVLYFESAFKLGQLIYTEKDDELEFILGYLGAGYYQLEQYKNAEKTMLLALKFVRDKLGKKHPKNFTHLNNLGQLYINIREYNNALPMLLEALEIQEIIVGKEHQDYGTSLNNLGLLYINMEEYEKALPFLIEALSNTEKNLGKDHSYYGTLLSNLAQLYTTIGNYEKALPLYIEALSNTEKSLGKDHSDYGIRLSNLAQLYTIIGNYNKALPLQIKALNNTEKSLGKDHSYYSTLLSNLAAMYRIIGEYDKALPLSLEALSNTEKSLGKDHSSYGIRLNNLALLYQDMGDYNKALPLYIKGLRNTEKSLGKDHSSYGIKLSNLASLYSTLGDNKKALPLSLEALKNIEKSLGKDHSSYGTSINNLASIYHDMGDYNKALPLYIKGLRNTEKSLGKDHSSYGTLISNLASIYHAMGYYNKALPLYIKALGNAEKSLGKDHSIYGIRLGNLALLYQDMGDYNKALSLYIEALSNTEKSLGKDHIEYGFTLSYLAGLYKKIGEYGKALPLSLEALKNTEKSLGKDHSSYGIRLNNLAGLYQKMGDYDRALLLSLESLKNAEKNQRKEHSNYVLSVGNLATIYQEIGEHNKALTLYVEALSNIEKNQGKVHSVYGGIMENLASFYLTIGEYGKALPNYISTNENLIHQLEQIFTFRSEKEKKAFLKTILHRFKVYQSFGYVTQNQFPELTEMNLNNQLLLKGLLLNSSKEVLEKLSILGDKEIDTKVLELRSNKTRLNKQYTLAFDKRSLNTDSLSEYINTQEAELVMLYTDKFGDNVTLTKNWKEVQKQLKNDELAIEFSHFRYRNNHDWTDSTLYVAYLMKKDWKDPKVVYLFEEEQLKSVIRNKTPNTLYTRLGDSLYNLIWKPLEEHLDGVETVYYGTDGLLHQLSFVAISEAGEESLSQQYNLVQLSSTAELMQPKNANTTQDYLLVGGVDYAYKSTSTKEPYEASFSLLNSESIKKSATTHSRGENWTYLPGTKKEVDLIKNLTEKSKNVTILSGKLATEESLKKLSGNSPDVLHIATHGYFFENLKQDEKRMQGEANTYKIAEDPLLRSGLLLAGGNYAWVNEGNPFEEEDGILTSLEISNLDLNNTELVVLSACKTGLGDIEGNEGVYGLYRAFKMAGVQSIIMSLWKIPDNETTEFMELFYTKWMKGTTIRAAFNSTQQTMQTKYANEPNKWAAFVLID
jgi:tetratricopeptide (TPR) repeat protein